jgi:hypothetical protein
MVNESSRVTSELLWFVVLGGLVSLVGHGIGIRRGLLRVPLLAEASPASALVFGVFEFAFYWCGIVALAAATKALLNKGDETEVAFALIGRILVHHEC